MENSGLWQILVSGMYKAFFDAIANDDPSLVSCSFYDGFKVCQVVDAIKKSSETGNWEYIDNTK